LQDKINVIKFLGIPDAFAVVVLTFIFILCLAPYFSGDDFGLFKIPQFTEVARKRLKIIGPIVFLSLVALLFIPMISLRSDVNPANTNRSNNGNLNSPIDNHNKAQQHIDRAKALLDDTKYEEAIKECNEALKLEPGNQKALDLIKLIDKTVEILNSNRRS
jgi:tetratricopeptide (TPR) repeat protein